MHTSVLKAAVVVALLSSPLAAIADSASVTQTGAFVSVTAGTSHFSVDRDFAYGSREDRNATAFGVLGGYRWVVARPFSFGVEAGYVRLGDTSWRGTYGGLSQRDDTTEKTRADAFLLGINGKWDLPYDLTVTARVGVSHARAKNDFTQVGSNIAFPDAPATVSRAHQSPNSHRIYGGVGFGYDFNENIGLTLSYDRYSYEAGGLYGADHTAKVGLLGLTLEYRFW